MSILQKIKDEPALLTGAIASAAEVAVSLGVIDDAQRGAVVAVASALVTLIGSFVVRHQVVPVTKLDRQSVVSPVVPQPTPVEAPAPDAGESLDHLQEPPAATP